MKKGTILLLLTFCFILYSFVVYTNGTESKAFPMNEKAIKGKLLFQKHNCTACHQLFGLGGYLGPELTKVISDRAKGELYAKAIIKSGTLRMPQFNLTNNEVEEIVEFLSYIDQTAKDYKVK